MLKLIKHDLPADLQSIKLYSISDLHVGEKSFHKKMFREFIKNLATDPNAYCVLAGDLLNNAITTSVSNTYEEEMSPSEAKKWLKKELLPIKNKILAMVSGNHENRTKKLTDNDLVEDIAEFLGIEHLYDSTELLVKLTFGRQHPRRKQMYSIYVTHGARGGSSMGASINATEKLSMSVMADIYIVGHAHKKVAGKHEYRHVDLYHEKITERERLFVVSSHWSEYFGGYAAKQCLQPSAKGTVPIRLYGDRKYFEATI